MPRACCARENRLLSMSDGRHISICKSCGDAELIASKSLKVPSPDEYNAYLESEVANARLADKRARWYKAKAVGYEQETRIKALIDIEVQPNQFFNLENGDDCEIKHGTTMRKGYVVALSANRLIAATELFPEEIGAGEEVQIRKPQSLGLATTQQQVFEMLCATNSDVDELVDPEALPELNETHNFEGEVPEDLNEEQIAAINHALSVPPQGIALIQGPPGTGKTTVIAHLIRLLREAGKSVLITAHTHVAIDNALERAVQEAPELKSEIARLGSAAKISDAMEPYFRTREDFEDDENDEGPLAAIFHTYPIVGMTLASLTGRMKSIGADSTYTPFDYVIVDEASMNLLPTTLVARAASHHLILVGDHLQLPPIIKDETYAKRSAFCRSSFEQIALARPDLVARLRVQYRSLPGIMAWSNHVLYQGELEDHKGEDVLDAQLLGSPIEGTLLWVDTSAIPKNEHLARWSPGSHSASYGNPRHVAVALRVVRELIAQGVKPATLGYIAPYRLQTAVFRKLAERHVAGGERIECSTVDSFQGREKDVIIFDLTTIEPQKSHASANRLNVSLTRARKLALIIGPADFAAGPAANGAYWSLQQWPDIQWVQAPAELEPAIVSEADLAIRTGDAAPASRLATIADLIDRLEYGEEHHVVLASAWEKRHDEQASIQKLWTLVSKVAPSTNVKALYAELRELDELPDDANRDVKAAVAGVKAALSYRGDERRRHLMLRAKAAVFANVMERDPELSTALEVEVARLKRLLEQEEVL